MLAALAAVGWFNECCPGGGPRRRVRVDRSHSVPAGERIAAVRAPRKPPRSFAARGYRSRHLSVAAGIKGGFGRRGQSWRCWRWHTGSVSGITRIWYRVKPARRGVLFPSPSGCRPARRDCRFHAGPLLIAGPIHTQHLLAGSRQCSNMRELPMIMAARPRCARRPRPPRSPGPRC